MNCIQTCCNDNIKLGFRKWPADFLAQGLRPSETLFFLVLLGLLTANFAKVYVDLREAIFWLPERTTLLLGWDVAGFYSLAAIWVSLLFPMLLLLPGTLVYLVGQIRVTEVGDGERCTAAAQDNNRLFGPTGLFGFLGQLALSLLPMILAAHLVLAAVKFNAKLGYLPLVLQDPTGVRSFLAISVMKTVTPPGVLVALDWLKWFVSSLLAAGFGASIYAATTIARKRSADSTTLDWSYLLAAVVSLLFLTMMYGATVYEWLFVR